ncbi:hypothetical protein NMY22_g13288 [Coprinellus aureogranulatus]|nr:hypothetical protein NMY22_g13288 [Coprinellus aureogranulatus]
MAEPPAPSEDLLKSSNANLQAPQLNATTPNDPSDNSTTDGSSAFFPPSEWQARNPARDVIPPKANSQPRKGGAAKRAQEVQRSQSRQKLVELKDDVRTLTAGLNESIKALAEKHGRKVKFVKHLAKNTSLYKPERQPTLPNALVHAKAEECVTKKLSEIREDVKSDPKMQDLTDDEKSAYLEKLRKHRDLQATGVRSSSHAANVDYAKTLNRLDREINNLHERTGVEIVAAVTRSHINDPMVPSLITTEGAAKFFPDTLGMAPGEFTQRFELYSVNRKKDGPRNPSNALQEEVARLVREGLRESAHTQAAPQRVAY